jgi:hypothetical protein
LREPRQKHRASDSANGSASHKSFGIDPNSDEGNKSRFALNFS